MPSLVQPHLPAYFLCFPPEKCTLHSAQLYIPHFPPTPTQVMNCSCGRYRTCEVNQFGLVPNQLLLSGISTEEQQIALSDQLTCVPYHCAQATFLILHFPRMSLSNLLLYSTMKFELFKYLVVFWTIRVITFHPSAVLATYPQEVQFPQIISSGTSPTKNTHIVYQFQPSSKKQIHQLYRTSVTLNMFVLSSI